MKKKLALALAAVMMLGLFAGCGPKEPAADTSKAPDTTESKKPDENPAPADDLRVDVFYYDFSDVYISTVRASLDQQLGELGIKPNNWDAAGSQPTQSDQVNTAITAGSKLLIVNIVETSTSDPAKDIVEAARTAGIPVIFFNREVADNDVINSYDKCAFVGTNAPDAGHMQGEMIGKYLLDNYDKVDLNGDGKISYVMFKGQEGNVEAEYRTQFSVEDANTQLTGAGKKELTYYAGDSAATKYLVDPNGAWSSAAATNYMDTVLAEYSEGNNNMVELVICNNDDMAMGAISSLQTAGYNNGSGKTIPVFGVDAVQNAKDAIAAGSMTGTVAQDAVGMASSIVKLLNNFVADGNLMSNTDGMVVDGDSAKIRVPYAAYLG